MAALFNDQPVLGVRIVADGTILHNNQPVIGVVEEAAKLFVGDRRVVGVDVLDADKPIHNDQPVRGVVMIGDGRKLYNGRRVVPVRAIAPPAALVAASVAAGVNLGNVKFNFTTPADANVAAVHVYRVPAGGTLDKAVHQRIVIPASPGASFSHNYGDPTRTNFILNGGFDDASNWSVPQDFSIGAGVATKVAGTTTRALLQSFDFLPYIWQNVRWTADFVRSAGTFNARVQGGVVQQSANITTSGKHRGSLPIVTGTSQIGISGINTAAGTVDNFVAYIETPSCAPQGDWDFYAFPAGASGIEGPGAAPIAGVVIV